MNGRTTGAALAAVFFALFVVFVSLAHNLASGLRFGLGAVLLVGALCSLVVAGMSLRR